MTLPYSYPSGITTISGMFTYANNATDGLVGILILIIFWTVTFMNLQPYQTKQAFLAANFVALILGTLLWITGLIASYVVVAFVMLTASGIILNVV